MHQELVLQFASPVTETEAAAAAVPSQQRLSPPPMQPSWTAIPRLDDLRICIVGDSGLQLNKSKKNGDTATLETYVRAVLGPNTDAICFPGKGASCITRYVETARSSADAVVVVWFLNELFTKRWKLVDEYPKYLDDLAQGLAAALRSFPYRAAMIGGSACLWKVPERFDIWADRVRSIVSSQGIQVVDGMDAYSTLKMTDDHWHAVNTPENKARLASYFANLVCELVDRPPEPQY